MQCRLCGREGKLVKAHAIPEAFFRKLREGKQNPILVSGSSGRTKRSPIGVYDDGILCALCEGKFGLLDSYGVDVIQNRIDDWFKPVHANGQPAAFQAEQVDQDRLLRFLVATLWRASVSTHSFYKRVALGPYEGEAADVVTSPNEPLSSSFGAVLSRWYVDQDSALALGGLMDPFAERWAGVNAYRVYLGEVTAYVKVDKRAFEPELARLALGATNTTTLVTRELGKSSDLAAMVHTAKQSFARSQKNRAAGQ